METMKPYETEHLSQVENGSADPTDQDIEFKAQEETKAMAKRKDDFDQNDKEEFFDSHSDINELVKNGYDEEEFYDSHCDIDELVNKEKSEKGIKRHSPRSEFQRCIEMIRLLR